MQRPIRPRLFASLLLASACCAGPGVAMASPGLDKADHFGDLDIIELAHIEVISPAKRPKSAFHTSAAIHVITQEDIRRSGATSIPEALRLVPGLQVARASARSWAVSARGLNATGSDKLLVLLDGRSVYSALFSGVIWHTVDYPLEDIERIEVILGPGGSLWGANAVNGVINIISKAAKHTTGLLASAGGGDEERALSTLRYGGQMGDLAYRAYAKYTDRDSFATGSGGPAGDDLWFWQSGMRADWESRSDTITLQADYYNSLYEGEQEVPVATPPFTERTEQHDRYYGVAALTRWTRSLGGGSSLQVQGYYLNESTERPDTFGEQVANTYDLELQHSLAAFMSNEITYGLGFRAIADDYDSTFLSRFDNSARNSYLYSTFVQDEISLIPGRLSLTLGSKLEHNSYSGFEAQPNVRAQASFSEDAMAWAAISRAVRTPSRAEEDGFFVFDVVDDMPATIVGGFGIENFDSEKLTAYEIGARHCFGDAFYLDLAAFWNEYDDLRIVERREPGLSGSEIVIPLVALNDGSASSYGGEISGTLQASHWLKLKADYSVLHLDVRGTRDRLALILTDGNSPEHQAALRSYLNLPYGFELDSALRFVDSLSGNGVPSYLALDLRLGWRPGENLEISVAAQNLLDSSHPEFNPGLYAPERKEVESGVYGKVTYRY